MPRFQSFSRFLHNFGLAKLANKGLNLKTACLTNNGHVLDVVPFV